jgi:hypothetical protein
MISISDFKGEIPRLSERLLPNNYAAVASNCDLEEGILKPIKTVSAIMDVGATVTSIFRMGSAFLQWVANVNVVRALVADSDNRILFTGDSYPKETNETLAVDTGTYPTTTRRLGIPAPTAALTITLIGTPGDDVKYSSSYVYTIVGTWADGSVVESAPSPASAVFDVYDDITPRLTGFVDATATGVYTTHYRIYRLNTGNVGAEFQLVTEVVITTTTYDDIIANADLGEVIPSVHWTSPDSDLFGLIATSYGIVVGFEGNTIYPSETYIPYAFPTIYSLVTESDIVGGGFTGSVIVVVTNTVPYMLIGQDPQTLALKRLGYQQPCVSARSIVNVPGGVAYATPDGLFLIDESSSGSLITEKAFTKIQWKALTPANIFGFYYDNKYVGFFTGTVNGFSIDLKTKEYQKFVLSQNLYGGYYSPEADLLYLVQTKSLVREIVSWKTGSSVDYTWKSKKYTFTQRRVYTAGIIQGNFTALDVDLALYVDGVLVSTTTVTSDSVFRLAPFPGTEFQIQLSGLALVDHVKLGQSVSEVVNG